TKPSCKVQDAFTGQRNLPARCRMLSWEQRNLPARCRALSRSNKTFLQGAGRFHGATKPSCKVQGAFTEQRNLPA
ncbi:hypothetical protein, partial [Tenacibaculum maritimum]|uniref:hypothetical protein n=1 Tax=Tenacibaculum maritimum TaxID=107401 RepID=UPI003876E5D4